MRHTPPKDLDVRVGLIRDRLRRFDFSAETEALIQPLAKHFRGEAYKIDPQHIGELQAITLLSEFYDAIGQRDECAKCLKPAATTLLKVYVKWRKPVTKADQELLRQQIWCMLAWAYSQHENYQLSTVAHALKTARDLLNEHLINETHPCSGTLYNTWHLQGLLYRDEGDIERALKAFSLSLCYAKKSLEENASSHPKDAALLTREREHFVMCQARTVAFGLAETEFLRGNVFRAQALFEVAEQTLTQEGRGFARWPPLIQLYKYACLIFTIEFDSFNASQRLIEISRQLIGLKKRLEVVNAHPDHVNFSDSLRLLALVRDSQIRRAMKGTDTWTFPLPAEGNSQISTLLNGLQSVFEKVGGPVARLVKRITVEALIRTASDEAAGKIGQLIRESERFGLYQVELKLLQVEHLLLMGSHDANSTIDSIRRHGRLTVRQNIWARLLSVASGDSIDDLLGEPETLDLLDDGYLRAFLKSVKPKVNVGKLKLPFQLSGGEDTLNLNKNLDVMVQALVRLAVERSPHSRKDIGHLLGRKHSWWGKYKKAHEHEPWFRTLMASTGRPVASAAKKQTAKKSSKKISHVEKPSAN